MQFAAAHLIFCCSHTLHRPNHPILCLRSTHLHRYTKPTPIQRHAIPLALTRRDLLACAQTGSGKTAAYLLPILIYVFDSDMYEQRHGQEARPTALILAPTRELVQQIFEEALTFAGRGRLLLDSSFVCLVKPLTCHALLDTFGD